MSTPQTAGPMGPGALPASATRRRPWMAIGIVVVLLVLGAALAYWYVVGRFVESTDDAYVGGDVTVMAPKVSGFVDQVAVHDNQQVAANQVLIQLDARDYQAHLDQAAAEVGSAQASVAELVARQALQSAVISQQQAALDGAQAELGRSAADQKRYRALVQDDAVSGQLVERADADLYKARAAAQGSAAALLAARRQLDVLAAQVGAAQARLRTAQAQQQVAALNLGYTTIRAPVAGYIGNRSARLGMLANAGTALLTIIPASGLWVDANFKEDQLKKMRVGDRVEVSLDALRDPIEGVVDSIAPATGATFSILPPENATGNFTKIVQRVPVRIRLNAPAALQASLRPGLSATVKVHLDDEHG